MFSLSSRWLTIAQVNPHAEHTISAWKCTCRSKSFGKDDIGMLITMSFVQTRRVFFTYGPSTSRLLLHFLLGDFALKMPTVLGDRNLLTLSTPLHTKQIKK